MYSRGLGAFIGYTFGLVMVTVIVFAALRWLNIPSGHFIDWIIGALTFWWLVIIVTVPWNIYFEAKAVESEASHSQSIGISVDRDQMKYVSTVASRALQIAVALHVVSAAGLFALSACGVTPIGYVGCAAALLLTGLRPAVRGYEYLWERLVAIKHRVHYPREDVVELRDRTAALESRVSALEHQLDTTIPDSFAAKGVRSLEEVRQRMGSISAAHNKLEADNQKEHERLSREGQSAIAKLSADSQFLDHVREIVRLIKSA